MKVHVRKHMRTLISITALLFLIILVAFRFDALRETIRTLQGISIWQISVMILATSVTYFLAAGSYKALAFRTIPFKELLALQIASGFANKLAPAGLGGMTLNGRYLTKHGHNTWQATAVAVTNNSLGFVGHFVLLLGFGFIAQKSPFPALQPDLINNAAVTVVFVVLGAAVLAALLFAKRLTKAVRSLKRSLTPYKKQKAKLLLALVLCMGITLTYCGLLWACVAAMGARITAFESLAVLTAGVFAGSVAPTPGGIGGAEAGLAAALAAIGLPASICLASALLYRLLTSWLPIIPGFVTFEVLNARKKFLL